MVSIIGHNRATQSGDIDKNACHVNPECLLHEVFYEIGLNFEAVED